MGTETCMCLFCTSIVIIVIIVIFDACFNVEEDDDYYDDDGATGGGGGGSRYSSSWIFGGGGRGGGTRGGGGGRCFSDTATVWTKNETNFDTTAHVILARNLREGDLVGTFDVSFQKSQNYKLMWTSLRTTAELLSHIC